MTTLANPTSATLAFGQSRILRTLASTLRAMYRLNPGLAARLAVRLFFMPFPTKLASRRRLPAGWCPEHLHTGQEGFTLLHRTVGQFAVDRPRVLLVHGWGGDALQMRALGDALAQAGWEPVLMDFPAHGRSPGWRCTMPQMVRSLHEAQACAGPFDAVVAHSMGTIATLRAVTEGFPVRRLAALAPSSSPASVLRWFGEALGLERGLMARMRTLIEGPERTALDEYEPAWFGKRVQTPVLLVHDRADRMAPFGNSRALLDALPAAALLSTEGLSHRRILADDAVIGAVRAHLAPAMTP